MYRILICDDEPDIVYALKVYLSTQKEYELFTAYTGKQALEVIAEHDIQLVLMDVMMPEMDGISATIRLRETSNIPVILLTAKGESADKVLGLDVGADDYITKPFDPLEVMARVKSQLRRYTALGAQVARTDRYVQGGIVLDDGDKSVTVDGEPVALTPSEYGILRLLMQNPGRVFSTSQIYEQVWNETALGSEHSVAVHIRHLREKIEINPSEPRYIKVVWGLGYKMEKGDRE